MRSKAVLIIVTLSWIACNKSADPANLGLDFFPLEVGDFRVYDLSRTTYLDGNASDTSYQIREWIISTDTTAGEITYLMRTQTRTSEMENWINRDLIGLKRTTQFLERRENNVSLAALAFPVQVDRSWDGNIFNTSSEQVYQYAMISESDPSYGDTDHIKVVIEDLPENVVEQDQRFEIYARNVGMTYRYFDQVLYCQSDCDSLLQPFNGTILEMTLVNTGNE